MALSIKNNHRLALTVAGAAFAAPIALGIAQAPQVSAQPAAKSTLQDCSFMKADEVTSKADMSGNTTNASRLLRQYESNLAKFQSKDPRDISAISECRRDIALIEQTNSYYESPRVQTPGNGNTSNSATPSTIALEVMTITGLVIFAGVSARIAKSRK